METCPSSSSSMSSSSSTSIKHASCIDSEKLPDEIPYQPRDRRKDGSGSLRPVRKAPAGIVKKPLTTTAKMHIAPFPPMKTKVYKVKPADFKEVVQKLTGVLPCSKPSRLRSVAPSPLNLGITVPSTLSSDQTSNNYKAEMEVTAADSLSPLSALYNELMENAATSSRSWFSDNNISPTTAWFSIPFQSPGTTLSVLEHHAAAL